jgi:hypothetical protein
MAQNIPQHFNAPDVDHQRYWNYQRKRYNGRGRPADTIVGPTVRWVRTAMEQSDTGGNKFFILYGLHQELKRVCVVYHICGTTLYVECLKTNISFYTMFDQRTRRDSRNFISSSNHHTTLRHHQRLNYNST